MCVREVEWVSGRERVEDVGDVRGRREQVGYVGESGCNRRRTWGFKWGR